MTIRKKRLLVPLGVLAVALLVLILVFDWNWLKGIAEAQASSALGRKVEIVGDLDVDLGLSPRITVEGLRIANADWASEQPLAEVPRVEVVVDLWALTGGAIVLPEIAVQEPKVLLERNAAGQANWQLGGPSEDTGAPTVPVVGDLTIEGADIRYHDVASGREVVANLATVEGQAPADAELALTAEGDVEGKPLRLQVAGQSRAVLEGGGEPVPFSVDLDLGDQSLTVAGSAANALEGRDVSASVQVRSVTPDALLALAGLPEQGLPPLELDAQVTREGDVIGIKEIDATFGSSDLTGGVEIGLGGGPLRVEGQLASDLVDLEDLNALWQEPALGTAADGAAAVEARLDDAKAALEAAQLQDEEHAAADAETPLGFTFGQLPPWTVDLRYTAQQIKGPEFQVAALDLHGKLEDRMPFLAATGSGTYQGQPVTLDVRVGSADQTAAASPFPIDAEIAAGQTRIDIQGSIQAPEQLQGVDVTFDARSQDLNQILAAAGVEVPAIPPFEVEGALTRQDQVWRLQNFSGQVGESRLQGTAAVDRSGERPFVSADLTSSRLLASDVMPGPQDGQAEEGQEEQSGENMASDTGRPIIHEGGVNLEALPDLDLDLSFHGDFVQLPEFRFEPIDLDVRIEDKLPVIQASGAGAFRNAILNFDVQLGTEQVFENRDAPYPFDVVLAAGETEATAKGTVADPGTYTSLDVDVSLEGPDLDQLGDILQISLPKTPPYALSGKLTHPEDGLWSLAGLNGRVGDSDLDGEFSINLAAERPTILADLHSNTLDFDDLAPLVGAPGGTDAGETASEDQVEQAREEAAKQQVLPDEPLEIPDLKAMDARVSFKGDNVNAPKVPLETVVIDLTLEDGRLRLEPLRFELAGGQLDATVDLDATPRPLSGTFDLAVRSIDMGSLLKNFEIEVAEIETQREGRGTLFGRARLETRGNSIAEMAGAADGEVALIMDGGRLNALIIEGLGLDVGEALGLLLTNDQERAEAMVPVNCFVADFKVQDGVMQTQALVLDTDDSKVVGAGRIDLGSEEINLKLKAHPRDASALSAGTPVIVRGKLADPSVEIVTDELVEKGLAAAALGVVLPVVGAVLPFIEVGEEVPNNCRSLIDAARDAGTGDSTAGSSN